MAATRSRSDRNQRRGIAIAALLHVVVIALLSIQWTAGDRRFDNPPMEVDLIAESALTSTAPLLSDVPPAARLGEEDMFDRLAPDVVPSVLPEPLVRPAPDQVPRAARTTPAPDRRQPPAAKASPPKAPSRTKAQERTARPTGRLDGITAGLSKSRTPATDNEGVPASETGTEVKQSIDVSIKAAVRPRWDNCKVTGFDVEDLKTVIRFRLTRSGALAGFTSVATSGQNASNKSQVQRHQECAKRAIELAAPFDLPPENYDFWQNYILEFIKKR